MEQSSERPKSIPAAGHRPGDHRPQRNSVGDQRKRARGSGSARCRQPGAKRGLATALSVKRTLVGPVAHTRAPGRRQHGHLSLLASPRHVLLQLLPSFDAQGSHGSPTTQNEHIRQYALCAHRHACSSHGACHWRKWRRSAGRRPRPLLTWRPAGAQRWPEAFSTQRTGSLQRHSTK